MEPPPHTHTTLTPADMALFCITVYVFVVPPSTPSALLPPSAWGLVGDSASSPGHESLAGRNAVSSTQHAAGGAAETAPLHHHIPTLSHEDPTHPVVNRGRHSSFHYQGTCNVARVQGRAGNFPPLTHILTRSEPQGSAEQSAVAVAARYKAQRHYDSNFFFLGFQLKNVSADKKCIKKTTQDLWKL